MTYICKNCYEEFNTPDKTSSRMGLAWIIFIFFSMGIGLIFWLFMRGKAKEICPHCKSENFVCTDSRAGIVIVNQFKDKEATNEARIQQPTNTPTQEEDDKKTGMIVIIVAIVLFFFVWNIIN